MKYILILFFVIGCESKVEPPMITRIVVGTDTIMVYDNNIDVSKVHGGIDGRYDTLTGILTITLYGENKSLDTSFVLDDYYEKSDTFLIYKETILPSGYSLSGKGMGKTVYKLEDTVSVIPDSIWITDNQVQDVEGKSKTYTASYDSLGNIYFKEK